MQRAIPSTYIKTKYKKILVPLMFRNVVGVIYEYVVSIFVCVRKKKLAHKLKPTTFWIVKRKMSIPTNPPPIQINFTPVYFT